MPALMEEVVKNIGTAQKNDPPLAPVAPYLHGTGGLFNRRDRENPVFSALMGPNAGVADAIPVFNGARNLDNQFGGTDWAFDSLITGQTAGNLDTFANQPTTPCADGPVAGLLKFCSMANTLGNYKMSTREVDIFRAGRVSDMTDAFTVQVANAMPQSVFGTPSSTPSLQNAVSNELASRIWEMVLGFQRMFYPRVFTGSPANNVGTAADIVGLDIHINRGNKVDSSSQQVCTAANSDVKNFGNALITSTTANIMAYLEMADAFVTYKARRQGLGDPTYMIAMRPELWQEITKIIPVRALQEVIASINAITNGRANVDGRAMQDERDVLRSSMMLPLNGRMVRVVVDDTIAETNLGNIAGVPTYTSTIYGIPMTVLGGYPVTFWEFFNHDNEQARSIQMAANGLTWTTDGGLFRWTSEFAKGCLKLNATMTPRLRMRTPQIAWRIDSVGYQPLQHFASWDPNSSYFVDGGNTTGNANKYYASWSTNSPVYPNQ
jgi:hypothetical protein